MAAVILDEPQVVAFAGQSEAAGVAQPVRMHRRQTRPLAAFTAAERCSLLACFLLERRQVLLDDVVLAHDNHMTGLMRRARHAAEPEARQLRQAAEAGLVTLTSSRMVSSR